jgi:lipopolysaccharide export system protein LptA
VTAVNKVLIPCICALLVALIAGLPPRTVFGQEQPPDPDQANAAESEASSTAEDETAEEPAEDVNSADAQVRPGPAPMPPPPGGIPPPPPGSKKPEGSVVGPQPPQAPLPDIARDQPGFIPDTSPEDLLKRPPPVSGDFDSLLGESQLPTLESEDIIRMEGQDPSRGLEQNFARVVVPTGTITGSSESKQFHIEGGLVIYYSDVTITAERADIDERSETAALYGAVEVIDPLYNVKADELLIRFKDKQFQAKGFVEFRRHAKANASQPNLELEKKERLREYFSAQQFELFCSMLYYDWGSKEMTALNSVRMVHPSFSGTMERVDYNDKDKEYEITGAVVLNVEQYDWLFANKLIDQGDEKRVRSITDNPTKITSDRVLYSDESGLAQFYALDGNDVKFDQSERSIVGSYMEVNDKTKDFYAEGIDGKPASYNQTDGQWLFNAELIKRDEASPELTKTLSKPLKAEARSITYNFDRKRLELRGGVSIVGEKQSLTAGEVVQDETAKFFLVRNNVVIKPDEVSEVYASQVYVDTQNDVFTFVGLVNGKFTSADLAAASPTAGTDAAGGDVSFQGQPGLFQGNVISPGITGAPAP